MKNRKWLIKTDYLSGRLICAAYVLYLVILCFIRTPYITYPIWYSDGRPPHIDVNIFPYVIIGTALFSMLAVGAVFSDTYGKNPSHWLSSVRPPMMQVFTKRIAALYTAFALPLCIYLAYAFVRMDRYYTEHITNPDWNCENFSLMYGYPIPDIRTYYLNIAVQLLVFLLVCMLINHALLALSGKRGVQVLVFFSYCTAEYFGFSLMFPKFGLITPAVRLNYDILSPFPTYTVFQLILGLAALTISLAVTKKKIAG